MVDRRSKLDRRLASLEAVVFDFDGTLARLEIDFGLMKTRVLRLVEEYGWRPSEEDGRYVLEIMAAVESGLAEKNPVAGRRFSARARSIVEGMEMESARRGGLFPESRSALTALGRAGFHLGLITRNFGAAVRLVFPDLENFFSVFLPRESVPRVKPDPGHLQAALKVLGVPPNAALMAGDHPIDIQTGQRAWTMTAGLASGRISRLELAAAGADLTFDRLSDLVERLVESRRISAQR